MATVRNNAASVGDDVQTLVARGLIVYTMPNLCMGDFENVEGDFAQGGTYNIESLSRIASATGAEPTTTSFTAPDEGPVSLTINQFYYGAVQIGSIINAIAKHDWKTLYKQSIRDGLKVQIDAGIASLIASFTNTVGVINTPFTDAQARRGVQYLDDGDVPQDGRFGVISPAEKNDKMGLERWTSKDYLDGQVVTKGQFAGMYNMPWKVSTNLTSDSSGHDGVIAHKEAIFFAVRKQPGADNFDLMNPNTLTNEVALTAIWGQAIRRNAFGVWLKHQ